MSEAVLCFPSAQLARHGKEAILPFDMDVLGDLVAVSRPVPRDQAESDETLKQFVVYGVVKSGDKLLSYRRTRRAGEARLRGLRSIGIGGHVNAGDWQQRGLESQVDGLGFFARAFWREVTEEVKLRGRPTSPPQPLCFINDNADAVGRVHFGLVYLLSIPEATADLREGPGLGELSFVTKEDAYADLSDFERWSQLIIESGLVG